MVGFAKEKWKIFRPYFGEFSFGKDFLDEKADKSPWILLKLVDAILRGIAQVR